MRKESKQSHKITKSDYPAMNPKSSFKKDDPKEKQRLRQKVCEEIISTEQTCESQ